MRWKTFRMLTDRIDGHDLKCSFMSFVAIFVFTNVLSAISKINYIRCCVPFEWYVYKSCRGRRLPKTWLECHDDVELDVQMMQYEKGMQDSEYLSQFPHGVRMCWRVFPYLEVEDTYIRAMMNPLKFNLKESIDAYKKAFECGLGDLSLEYSQKVLAVYEKLLQKECGGFIYCKLWEENVRELSLVIEEMRSGC